MIDLSGKTPYNFQLDSSNPSQAARMCFSASCASLLEGINPGVLRYHPDRKNRQMDDFYREVLQAKFGDTVDSAAQLRTLRYFCPKGWAFAYRQDCDWKTVQAQLEQRIPVPFGWLHHGPIGAPTGGGHWCCAVGWEGGDAGYVIVHDPYGEADLVNGGYVSNSPTAGKSVRYSANNLGRRWMVTPVNGRNIYTPGTGWAILASKKGK